MSTNPQQMRLIQSLHQPSPTFTLYDYTKIVYPIQGYLCLRQMLSPVTPPTFLKHPHPNNKIHHIHSFPSLIITIQSTSTNQYFIGMYSTNYNQVAIGQSLVGTENEMSVGFSQTCVFIVFSAIESRDCQVVVVGIKQLKVLTRAFFIAPAKDIVVKNDYQFTVLVDDHVNATKNHIEQYQLLQNNKNYSKSQYPFSIVKKKDLYFNDKSSSTIARHIWLKEQLIIVNKSTNALQILVQNKIVQSISLQNLKQCKNIVPIICGFILTNQNFLQVYKKHEMQYVCIAEFFAAQIGFSDKILLSPQQDILSYYQQSKSSIQYVKNFNQEVELSHLKKIKNTRTLNISGSIYFQKDAQLKIRTSKCLNTLAMCYESTLSLYSLSSFSVYLSCQIQSQSKQSRSVNQNCQSTTKSLSILQFCLHPSLQIIAISTRYSILIYQILFDSLQLVKEIGLSNVTKMQYSQLGGWFNVIVQGKNGTKLYLYDTHNYQLKQTLTIGKRITKFIWSKYDHFLLAYVSREYYVWHAHDLFKHRKDFNITFQINDVILNYQTDSIILYGINNVLQLKSQQIKQQPDLKYILKSLLPIKQILFQNNVYFILIGSSNNKSNSQFIIKTPLLSSYQQQLQSCNFKTGFLPKNIYFQSSNSKQSFLMLSPSANGKKNLIILLDTQTKDIKVLEYGQTSNLNIKNLDLVRIDRSFITKLYQTYKKYQNDVKQLQSNMKQTIIHLKSQLKHRQQQKQKKFISQIKCSYLTIQQLKAQCQRLQQSLQSKLESHQIKTIKQVHQIQKLYQRKLALTTNKLLTSQQLNYRTSLIAQQSLSNLQQSTNQQIIKIRNEYNQNIKQFCDEKDMVAASVQMLKKQYQSRLYLMEQQNQKILQQYQDKADQDNQKLRANLVNWEIKFSQVMSKNNNFQQQLINEQIIKHQLRDKLQNSTRKNQQYNKKVHYLNNDLRKYEQVIQQKNSAINIYQSRINDLEKSNQILKYRVIQLKGQTLPKGQQNFKLKQNLNQLQQQYSKIVKSCFQKQQQMLMLKKQLAGQKSQVSSLSTLLKKQSTTHLSLTSSLHTIRKLPTSQLKSNLLKILNNLNVRSTEQGQSPLGQLNRIRQHLEVTLTEVVEQNQKGHQRKKLEMDRKNRENSELLKQINQLRRRLRDLQASCKQKDLQINRMIRGDPISVNLRAPNQRQITNQSPDLMSQNNQTTYPKQYRQQSRSQTRKLTRQTKQSFFQKSLFKTGCNWREKRLKTQYTSNQRPTQSREIKRNQSGKYLQIENQANDVQDYKRALEQKEIIIKQLINKIQSLE